MKLKALVEEDFVNYKKASMFLIFPFCTFKCEKDCGIKCCQNSSLALAPIIEISTSNIIERYLQNPITKSIVLGGLEPLDSFDDVFDLISHLREKCDDDIIIYTGYREDEIQEKVDALSQFRNIIVKFGRFIPNDKSIFDPVLGVTLASQNQYAKKIS